MDVIISRYPTQEDWNRAKMLALGTEGKEMAKPADDEWKKKMLKCEHSPIRTLMFTIELVDIPYWVSVHFARHKYGVEHYVKTQRNDRQSEYDRTKAPQGAPVNHILDINAQELMFMARKRLCSKAAEETKFWMIMIVDKVVKLCPEFKPFLVPQCAYLGRCPEIKSCGMFKDNERLTANEYQANALRTAKKGDMKDMLIEGVMGLSGEAGECLDLLKKHLFQGHELDKEHMAKELGDVAWYLAVASEALGYDLESIFKMNIAKLEARYPDGFEADKSVHRKEGDV